MRMVSAIDVNWVAPLLPKLKDPVDVDKLSGRTVVKKIESKEEEKKDESVLGKRKPGVGSDKLHEQASSENISQSQSNDVKVLTKEEKLAQLKERFLKR